jgi:nicotinamidase-related amidase
MARAARLPPAGQGAPPRVPFALVLVDFVNPLDFPGAEDLAPDAEAAARAAATLRRRVVARGGQVIFANDNYGLWQSDFGQLRRLCARLPGVPSRIAKLLPARRHDIAVLKPRHSAFFQTPLALLLEQMHCRRVILAGLATDNCILFTAMDAYLRGYSLWVPSDCTAAESRQARDESLAHMARVLKADTRPALKA